ncbi:hypothetical protein KNV00_gp131 [Streptomyces phage Bmoc]|uniref:Uncharacterized protein n=1 Tax=Streptomyces phage Bmoc TaxID=2725629 RepID=A0A6M3T0H1_9CAUD|nr:hypothetical protein KNV00_gp131 [Streptomyces phage Bmoc]QJD50888.1 hypothetical protein SEA_BMOC_164 [Streptomyces phage Bmoc]
MGNKVWNKGDKVIRNNNTDAGTVEKQDGRWVIVTLDTGGQKRLGANDLKRRR